MSKTRHRQIRSFAVNFSPGHRIDWHTHDWHQLLFATSGVVYLTTKNSHWIIPPHRAIWIPSNLEHKAKMVGSVSLRTLYFGSRMRVLGDTCRAVNVSNLMRELIVHICDVGSVKDDSTDNRALIQLLVSQAKKMKQVPLSLRMPIDIRAVQVASHIIEHPSAELADIASRNQIGLRTLQRLFRNETGLSLGRWRRHARLLSSLSLLEKGRSVTDVSFDVGFDSVSAFISVFRNFFGITPAKYFRNPRAKEPVI